MKTSNKAFTLTELLVVIALIMIIALWMRGFSVNTISHKQNLDRTIALLIGQFETMRGDALLWKGKLISWTIKIPKGLKATLEKSWDGKVSFSYSMNWTTFSPHPSYMTTDFNNKKLESITKIECSSLDWTTYQWQLTNWEKAYIDFSQAQITVNWDWDCNNTTYNNKIKIIKITFKREIFTRIISINSLSGLITIE